MSYSVFESEMLEGSFRVESSEHPAELVSFAGAYAERRAKEYAKWKNETGGAVNVQDWSDSLWLLKFLKEQQTTFNGDKLPPLLDHDFWSDLSEAVNGLDLPTMQREFAKMSIWLRDNSARSPTARGIRKFVAGWMERAYDRERRYGGNNVQRR